MMAYGQYGQLFFFITLLFWEPMEWCVLHPFLDIGTSIVCCFVLLHVPFACDCYFWHTIFIEFMFECFGMFHRYKYPLFDWLVMNMYRVVVVVVKFRTWIKTRIGSNNTCTWVLGTSNSFFVYWYLSAFFKNVKILVPVCKYNWKVLKCSSGFSSTINFF